MSDITIAILILPLMTALVVALECSKVGCTRLKRRIQKGQSPVLLSQSTSR